MIEIMGIKIKKRLDHRQRRNNARADTQVGDRPHHQQ